ILDPFSSLGVARVLRWSHAGAGFFSYGTVYSSSRHKRLRNSVTAQGSPLSRCIYAAHLYCLGGVVEVAIGRTLPKVEIRYVHQPQRCAEPQGSSRDTLPVTRSANH